MVRIDELYFKYQLFHLPRFHAACHRPTVQVSRPSGPNREHAEGGCESWVDYKVYVQEFIGLEPRVFHVSNGRFGDERYKYLGIKGEV